LTVGPDRVYTVEQQVAGFRSYPTPIPVSGNIPTRNDYITEQLYLMDLEYSIYFAQLTNQTELGDLAGDLVLLGLTAGSTVSSSKAAKTALSAAATAVTGATAAIDKDILLSHTIQVLQIQMEASRSLIRDRITANLNCPYSVYTIWQGLSDLEDYYRAGTLPGALEALAAATGNSSQQAKNVKNGKTPNQTPVESSHQGTTPPGGKVAALRLAAPLPAPAGPRACPLS
jgi:hypothetical protein